MTRAYSRDCPKVKLEVADRHQWGASRISCWPGWGLEPPLEAERDQEALASGELGCQNSRRRILSSSRSWSAGTGSSAASSRQASIVALVSGRLGAAAADGLSVRATRGRAMRRLRLLRVRPRRSRSVDAPRIGTGRRALLLLLLAVLTPRTGAARPALGRTSVTLLLETTRPTAHRTSVGSTEAGSTATAAHGTVEAAKVTGGTAHGHALVLQEAQEE